MAKIIERTDVEYLRQVGVRAAKQSRIYMNQIDLVLPFSAKGACIVRTYRYEDYPIMMSSGKHYYQDLFTYYGTAGYSYHALAYCYAGDSTGYDEKLFSTATKKAT